MGSLIEWMQQQSNQAALLYPHTSKKFGAVAQEMREAQSRIAELEADVARLRGALGEIADTDPPPEWNNYSGITAIRRLAIRALTRTA